jgi:hypothetical protein
MSVLHEYTRVFYTFLHESVTDMFRVQLGFLQRVDRGAHVTRVTMPTAQYLALGKFFQNY